MTQTLPLLKVYAVRQSGTTVSFQVEFPAPSEHTSGACAPATLDFGDGSVLELGTLCGPTISTWREARRTELATHTYPSSAPYRAKLTWGEQEFTIEVPAAPETPAVPPVEVLLFDLQSGEDDPLRARLSLRVKGLSQGTRLRVDGGADQVFWLEAGEEEEREGTWTLVYAKPGTYDVTADLVDDDGFWLARVAEGKLQVGSLEEEEEQPRVPAEAPPLQPAARLAIEEMAHYRGELPVWMPFRYARPVWAYTRTYAQPGGGRIARILPPGTYISIRDETVVDGNIWYKTAGHDWVPASSVVVVHPSDLRGVTLRRKGGASPPPPPPPPPTTPTPTRRGIVTAYLLNVRARPGVRPDNPPIDRLRQGTEVTIYEETTYQGEPWFRIGDNRWVHGSWVRVITTLPRPAVTEQPDKPIPLPVGWVVASSLNVRARPGVSADNPPIDRVHYKDTVRILEERVVNGATWYRIGEDRWVYGGWIGVARYKPRPASIGADERWVGVCLKEQTAVAYEGDEPVYAALVATGLPQFPTVQGIFRTWLRRKWGKMSGGTPGTGTYYYLEDVTWTMYFYQGYALHTAYWHDAFGRPRSHGCVNMSPYDAWWIFQWSGEVGDRSPVVYVYWA